MNTDRSHRLNYSKNHDLKFIQEFVNTKVYNPDLIEKLKLKQLKKSQLIKAKLRQENLQSQLQKTNNNLIKIQKIHAQLKESTFVNDKESFQIQKKIILMEEKVQKLPITLKHYESQVNYEKNSVLKELKTSTEKAAKDLEDDLKIFENLIEGKKQKLLTVVEKKLNLKERLLVRKNELKLKKDQNKQLKRKIQEKRQHFFTLDEKKQTLSQGIKSKFLLKEQNLKTTKVKVSQNTKFEEQCIKKLAKFVKELNMILQDPISALEQKKNMIDLLLNVYCPDETVKNKVRSLSISPEKLKHDSIQTRISLQNGSQSSLDENTNQKVEYQPKIPLLLLHSLEQLEIKYGLKKKQRDSLLNSPVNIRKQSSNQQTEIKSRLSKTNRRDSLPTSLNEKDLQQQFQIYCQNQLKELQVSQRILDEKQGKISKEIHLLTEKCKQKDAQIQSISDQKQKSYQKK